MSDRYVLNADHSIEKMDDLVEWAKRFEMDNRVVAFDTVVVEGNPKPVEVSTVFLGLDHSFGHGPPLLFETMVFGGKLDQEMARYATYADAQRGHDLMVSRVRSEG